MSNYEVFTYFTVSKELVGTTSTDTYCRVLKYEGYVSNGTNKKIEEQKQQQQ